MTDPVGLALSIPGLLLQLRDFRNICKTYTGSNAKWREQLVVLDFFEEEVIRLSKVTDAIQLDDESDLSIDVRKWETQLLFLHNRIATVNRRIKKAQDAKVPLLSKLKNAAFGDADLCGLIGDIDRWLDRYARSMVVLGTLDKLSARLPPRDDSPTSLASKVQDILHAAAANPSDLTSVLLEIPPSTQTSELPESAPIEVSEAPDGLGRFILERKPAPDNDATRDHERAKTFVVSFTRRLREVDSARMHVLRARGYAFTESKRTFDMVFDYPTHLDSPRTLRTILLHDLKSRARHSLDQRFTLAREIATGLFYLHAARFVHKNLRPEVVVLFHNTRQQVADPAHDDKESYDNLRVLGEAYITGFTELRDVDGHTILHGEDVPWRNIYRHPERQGVSLQKVHHMLHDVYSFGVILVELALLESFVEYRDGDFALYQQLLDKSRKPLSAEDVKSRLIKFAKNDVPRRMGQKYADLAAECLQSVDNMNDKVTVLGLSEDELLDADQCKVEQRYMGKVVERLEELSI